jgi:hypothetical protein
LTLSACVRMNETHVFVFVTFLKLGFRWSYRMPF